MRRTKYRGSLLRYMRRTKYNGALSRYDRMIKKIAWSFCTTTDLEFEDLLQEAYIAYLNALETYDVRKAKMSTYIWHCVHTHLNNILKKEARRVQTYEILYAEDTQANHTSWYEDLNAEAKEMAEIIIRSSKKYIGASRQKCEERIIHIMQRKGWSEERIELGIHNLKLIYHGQ